VLQSSTNSTGAAEAMRAFVSLFMGCSVPHDVLSGNG
jgi:hypothetical protein